MRWIGMLVVVLAVALGAVQAMAHPVLATTAIAMVERDGRIEVAVRHDALAFALNDLAHRIDDRQMEQLFNGPAVDLEHALAEGRTRFQLLFEVMADGVRVPMEIAAAPTVQEVEAWKNSGNKPLLPVKLEFVTRGTLSLTTKTIVLRFPEVMGDVVLTVQSPGEEPLGTLVRAGERSEAFAITLSAGAPAQAQATPAAPAVPSIASFSGAMRFVVMGFEHIVPEGLDHILFVLGLFFLSPRVKPLLLQITAFTIAHSVTLALSARGVVNLPSSIVEPTIAASIAFVAIENICTQKVHSWRPLVVFGFGLIHGLGFASAFAEAFGTPRIPLGPVLLFNVGVELGQLSVVAGALLAAGWFRNRAWYRPRIAIPASVLIACVGLYWTVQRVFFMA